MSADAQAERPGVARLQASRIALHAATVFAVSATGLLLVEHALRGRAAAGVWFQAWTSERMMQTVSIVDLKREPLASLYFLHIQPPALDAVRACLAAVVSAADPQGLLMGVDRGLYVVWAGVYAGTAALIFAWLAASAGWRAGLCAAAALCLHPAAVANATLLDATALTALELLWFHRELALLAHGAGSPQRLALSVIALFATRSLFQWPFLVVVVFCLLMLRVPARRIARFALIAGAVIGIYLAKQYLLFGVTYTSTFAGYNCSRAVGLQPLAFVPSPPIAGLPGALARDYKFNGRKNYNQLAYLAYNRAQLARCASWVAATPVPKLVASVGENLQLYLRPTSRYVPNAIVDRMPWRPAYDAVFQGVPLVGLLLAAAFAWLAQSGWAWRRSVALALPSSFVVLVCVLAEKGENMRFKFFLEPLWIFFISQQLASSLRSARAYLGARRTG